METIEYKEHKIKIFPDETPMNPRTEHDNLGTMVCFHSRYNLGDETNYNSGMFSSWADMRNSLIKELDIAVILPIYMYDHSGMTISTTPFSCPWDSGQIGFVFITKEKVRKEYSRKNMSAKLVKQIASYLVNEVKTYDDYLTGSVYGYQIEDKEEKEGDSCWGFFGYDHEKSGLLEYAKNAIDCSVST